MKFNYQKLEEFSKISRKANTTKGFGVEAAAYYAGLINDNNVLDNYSRELIVSLLNFNSFNHYQIKIFGEKSTKFFEIVSDLHNIKNKIYSGFDEIISYARINNNFPICSKMFITGDFKPNNYELANDLQKAAILSNVRDPILFADFIREYELLLLAGIKLAKNIPEINLAVYKGCGVNYDMFAENNQGINNKSLGYRGDFLDYLADNDIDAFVDTWLTKDFVLTNSFEACDKCYGVIDNIVNAAKNQDWLLNFKKLVFEKCQADLSLVNHYTLPIIAHLIDCTHDITINDNWLVDYIQDNPKILNNSNYNNNLSKKEMSEFKLWLNTKHILKNEQIPDSYKIHNFNLNQIEMICNKQEEKVSKVIHAIYSQSSLFERVNFAQHFLKYATQAIEVKTLSSIFDNNYLNASLQSIIINLIEKDKQISLQGCMIVPSGKPYPTRLFNLMNNLINKQQTLSKFSLNILNNNPDKLVSQIKKAMLTGNLQEIEQFVSEVKPYINHNCYYHVEGIREANLMICALNIMCKNPETIADNLELLKYQASEFLNIESNDFPFINELLSRKNDLMIGLESDLEVMGEIENV